jgi:hypothetical protein
VEEVTAGAEEGEEEWPATRLTKESVDTFSRTGFADLAQHASSPTIFRDRGLASIHPKNAQQGRRRRLNNSERKPTTTLGKESSKAQHGQTMKG